MVFQKKLTGPGPRTRRSAYEVARDLQCDLHLVLEALENLGEYVASPRKRNLEAPTVRAIYERLGQTLVEERPDPPSGWRIRTAAGPASRRQRPVLEIEHDERGPRSFGTRRASLGLGIEREDAVGEWAFQEWKLYGFTEVDRDVWLAEGLRPGQAKLARDLRDGGLHPSDLSVDVLGWTVAKRLRAGESIRNVHNLLRSHRATD